MTKLTLYRFSVSVTLKLDRLGLIGFFSQRNWTLVLDGTLVCARAVSGRPSPSHNPAPTMPDAKNIRRDEVPFFADNASSNASFSLRFSKSSSLEKREACNDGNFDDVKRTCCSG